MALAKGRRKQAQFRQVLSHQHLAWGKWSRKGWKPLDSGDTSLFGWGWGGNKESFGAYNQLCYSCIMDLAPLRETTECTELWQLVLRFEKLLTTGITLCEKRALGMKGLLQLLLSWLLLVLLLLKLLPLPTFLDSSFFHIIFF